MARPRGLEKLDVPLFNLHLTTAKLVMHSENTQLPPGLNHTALRANWHLERSASDLEIVIYSTMPGLYTRTSTSLWAAKPVSPRCNSMTSLTGKHLHSHEKHFSAGTTNFLQHDSQKTCPQLAHEMTTHNKR